jgi:uncharacterized repeat protein (TIGR03803 family)
MTPQQRVSTSWMHTRAPLRAALALAAIFALVVVPTQSARAQTFTVLYDFTGGNDGSNPYAGLILDPAGNLYGTTQYGGTYHEGTVFELDTTGQETVLQSFNRGQGMIPRAGVIRDSAGNLYGAASEGGGKGCGGTGCGTVFKLTNRGKLAVLHYFDVPPDGNNPWAGLVRDSAGNLYGTTVFDSTSGNGTVFKVDKFGKETLLYTFNAQKSGKYPYGSLVRDPSGDLYGTTSAGGIYSKGDCSLGCGTVFKLTPAGKYTALHRFAGGADGSKPLDGLVCDSAGNLYGTTELGGTSDQGTIFKVSKTGTETVLYSFTGGADGANPRAALLRDTAGNLYGVAAYGGKGGGTVFKLTSAGDFTVLHTFSGPDGSEPFGGLATDSAGNLYGTTEAGGTLSFGTVFKITP